MHILRTVEQSLSASSSRSCSSGRNSGEDEALKPTARTVQVI